MKYALIIGFLLLAASAFGQDRNVYEVYAIEYSHAPTWTPVKDIALNTNSPDSVQFAFYFWYLKGAQGKKILVDAGCVPDSAADPRYLAKEYVRPDLALQRLNVRPNEITDIIITHPHYDHIGGIGLFPDATVWIQREDYVYLVADAWQPGGEARPFAKADVRRVVDVNLERRLRFVNGDSVEILPGIRAFTGSRHTIASQHLLVNTASEKVLLASDDAWFYANLTIPASVPLTTDPQAYLRQLKRMKTLVTDQNLIIPGHDAQVMQRFPSVANGVVRIR